jgi:hypothetical protein
MANTLWIELGSKCELEIMNQSGPFKDYSSKSSTTLGTESVAAAKAS